LLETRLEAARVELVSIEIEEVTRRARDEQGARAGFGIRLERLAEARDIDMEQMGCTSRRSLAPELVDHLVARDNLARPDEQDRQECARLRTSQIQNTTAVAHLERP